MEVAEFEEKQYETGLQLELAGSSVHSFSSGQALEALVGYDFAMSPGSPLIWDLLDAGLPPGILLTPSLWPIGTRPDAERLPPHLVSLIIQAKRPQRLHHWRAGQDHYWRGPYYRFHLDERQQRILEHLERVVASHALVRYASAAFIEYSALIHHQLRRTIARHSSFVSPESLSGHRLWSYSGPGTTGYANPEGAALPADTIEVVLKLAQGLAIRQSLSDHIRALADSLDSDREVNHEWLFVLSQALDLNDAQVETVASWSRFASAVATTGATWLVLAFEQAYVET